MGAGSTRRSGIGTSATHMEWFFGPKGLRFSEIGCRPPGVGAWDLYSAGNDLDLYREWADAIVHGAGAAPAVAPVLPPASSRCGRTATARSPATPASTRSRPGYGEWVIDAHLPDPGHADPAGRRPATWPTPTSACGTPTSTSLRGMLDDVGRTVRVHATDAAVTRSITLLGPQRSADPGPGGAVLDLDGPFATVTAGWQEREADDAELDALLGRAVASTCALHARWLDVVERDPEYAVAEREHRAVLDELQAALPGAAGDGAAGGDRDRRTRRRAPAGRGGGARADAEAVRPDRRRAPPGAGAASCARRSTPPGGWRSARRSPGTGRRCAGSWRGARRWSSPAATSACCCSCCACSTWSPYVPPTVVAWSAGAMALTERVVLFHDRAAQGAGADRGLRRGLGLVPGVVLLPHARRRLRDRRPVRMAVLARRFAPARCVVLDDGVRLDLGPDGALPPDARVVDRRRSAQVAAA